MKSIPVSVPTRSHFHRWLFGCTAAVAMAAAPLMAEVAVNFNSSLLPGPSSVALGVVTLTFTVDGSGNASLDASTNSANTSIIDAINVWDGNVGTVSFSGAYNSSFTLTTSFSPTTASLRLSNQGSPAGSLGVNNGAASTNQYRIDSSGAESIKFTAGGIPAGTKLKVTSIDSRNHSGIVPMKASSGSVVAQRLLPAQTPAANGVTWDLSASGLLLSSTEIIELGTYLTTPATAAGVGYSMGALRFDIINGSSLSAPSGLVATTDGSQVVLDWNDTPNAISYSVYRSATAGGPYGTAIATGLGTSAFTDATVTTGSTYYYVVTASDASSQSGNSAESSIAVVIPAPTGLTRTQGNGTINLDWVDSTSPIFASYSVYRSTTSGGPYTSTATGLTTSAYSDSGVINGTTYYYVVKAIGNVSSAESVNSAQVSGTPYVAVSGNALYAQLDGSVAASVTEASTIVSAWADQTANGFNASSTGGIGSVLYPSSEQSLSGLYGLDMGTVAKSTLTWFSAAQQDQWLDFSSGAGALPYGGFAVFAVVQPYSILGGTNRDVVISSTETEFSLRYEGGRPQVRLGSTILQGTAGVANPSETLVLAVSYNSTTGALKLSDSKSGTTTSVTVAAADFSSATAIYLGGSSNPDQYMRGMLGEAKVYRGTMTPTEFGNQQAALTYKWAGLQKPAGLTGTLGSSTVVLDWNDQVADYYTISRSTDKGGPYSQLATNITSSTYTDNTVSNDTIYYYVVSAFKSTDGESQPSTEFGIMVAGSTLYTHLDATNAASVSTTTSIVNAWQDLTANGINAVEVVNGIPAEDVDTGDVLYPSTSLSATGLAGLNFGPARNLLQLFDPIAQDAWLDFSNIGEAQPYSGFAVFIALKADSILGAPSGDNARDVVLANADTITGKFAIRYESGKPAMYLNGVAASQGSNRIVAGDTVILAANYNAATGALEFWDSASGTSASTTVPAADFSSLKSMHLGGSINPAQRMDGMIGEVKIYRGTMTSTEFATEKAALTAKWVGAAGYSSWITGTFANGTVPALQQGANADPDNDGISNLLEYAIADQDPTVANASVGTFAANVLSYTKRADANGLTYSIEESTDLGVADAWAAVTPTVNNATTISYTLPVGPAKDFLRLKVSN
jgi:fibronectin type 3 domain-containing protein